MKYIFGISCYLLFLFPILQTQAQECNDQTHSVNINDSWLSCTITANPNPNRANSHWIMYDFGYTYTLTTTRFWNYNVAGATDKGLKNITIDYSQDGSTWTEVAVFQLGIASGLSTYTGEDGPNLNGIAARHLLISATDTWGDNSCAGLSEVRFDIGSTVNIIQAKVLLAGAYTQNGEMNVDLQATGLLPNQQPFNRAPWFYAGSENAAVIPANVTDWLLLEVRDVNNNAQIIEQRAAFVNDEGILTDVDGSIGVKFYQLSNNTNYQLIVRSRHHLALASMDALVLPQLTFYDFRDAAKVLGGIGQLQVTPDGYFCMKAGDVNSDGLITVSDFNDFADELSAINVFSDADFNLDGHVTVSDFNLYQSNSGAIGVALVRY